jgi:hypothetical protein
MKKIIIASLVLLSSCSSLSPKKCIENVKKAFPNSKVYKFENSRFAFIVIDSTGIKKVTCYNLTNSEIDGVYIGYEK